MSYQADRYVFEIQGEPMGILVRDETEYVFHASASPAWTLDRRRFRDLHEAERAVIACWQTAGG